MRRCWVPNPTDRPYFAVIHERLDNLISSNLVRAVACAWYISVDWYIYQYLKLHNSNFCTIHFLYCEKLHSVLHQVSVYLTNLTRFLPSSSLCRATSILITTMLQSIHSLRSLLNSPLHCSLASLRNLYLHFSLGSFSPSLCFSHSSFCHPSSIIHHPSFVICHHNLSSVIFSLSILLYTDFFCPSHSLISKSVSVTCTFMEMIRTLYYTYIMTILLWHTGNLIHDCRIL